MNRGPLPSTYERRDLPVLVEVVRRLDATRSTALDPNDLLEALDMRREELQSALLALTRRNWIVAEVSDDMPPAEVLVITGLTGEAYIRAGLHPDEDDDLAALIEVIRQAADNTDDADEKSRLRRLAGVLTDASGDVLKLAIATWLATRVPA